MRSIRAKLRPISARIGNAARRRSPSCNSEVSQRPGPSATASASSPPTIRVVGIVTRIACRAAFGRSRASAEATSFTIGRDRPSWLTIASGMIRLSARK